MRNNHNKINCKGKNYQAWIKDKRLKMRNSYYLLFRSFSGKKERASLLIDRYGLERAEGVITAVNSNHNVDVASIVIDGSNTILMREIIGVNDFFRSDYSEC